MAAWVSMEMTRVLRQDLYRRIQGLSCTQADQFSPSSLVSRLTNDTYNVHQMFNKVQRGGIRAPMLVLGGLILTFLLEPSLALVQLAVSLLTFLTITLVTRRGIPHYTRAQAAVDTVVRILRENAAGVRVVKALACQVRERDRFDTANQAQRQAEAQAGQVMALANPITDLLLNAGLILVVLVGALRVNAGLMPPGQIVAFMTYFTLIQSATLGLAKVFVKVSKGAASARRIQEVLLAPEQQRQTAPLPAGGGFLGMDRVTFSYQGTKPDVEAASFLLRQGGMLGILGPTGSGKSTLMHLLLGFRAPTQGRILFDGRDAAGLSKHTLRRGISSVLQGAAIYSGTIGENIRMGDPDADDAAVTEAARIAQLADFIASCDGGLSYEIRQAGKNLSGGQKQRLAIARAIIKDAPIYIFDDSFSALDFLTEKNLRTALNRRIAGRTQIVVTQRITSAMSADCIFVMDGGCLVDSGTHNELLARCRIYREIYASQTGGDLQ